MRLAPRWGWVAAICPMFPNEYAVSRGGRFSPQTTMTRQPATAAARTLSSNEAWPSENEVWVWQSTSEQAGMAAPMRQANPLHCNGAAPGAPGTPQVGTDWKGQMARKDCRTTSTLPQNMYVSLQKLQKMTCLEAGVHVWVRRWSVGFLRTRKIAFIARRHTCAARDVLAFG